MLIRYKINLLIYKAMHLVASMDGSNMQSGMYSIMPASDNT